MRKRTFSALGALLISLCVAACGSSSSVSSSDVANVAGNPISKQAFNHWMYVAEKSNAQESGAAVIVPTDPPKFTSCIAQVRAQIPTYKTTATATLRKDCQTLFTSLSSQVMDFLIKAYWYQGTAYQDNIRVTQAELNKDFKAAQKSTFPTTAEYKAFLAESGETTQDIDFRLRVNSLYQKLVVKREPKVTTAAEQKYYAAHKAQFGTPASADIRLVETQSASTIAQAAAALKSGQSWAAVAKRYSTDSASKATGGVIDDVTADQEEAAVNKYIFSAPTGQVSTAIHGTFGYYLVEVTKRTAAVSPPFSKLQTEIKSQLLSAEQTSAENSVNTATAKRWKSSTHCASAYSMDDCTGYTAPKTTTSASPAGSGAGGTVSTAASSSSSTSGTSTKSSSGTSTKSSSGTSTK